MAFKSKLNYFEKGNFFKVVWKLLGFAIFQRLVKSTLQIGSFETEKSRTKVFSFQFQFLPNHLFLFLLSLSCLIIVLFLEFFFFCKINLSLFFVFSFSHSQWQTCYSHRYKCRKQISHFHWQTNGLNRFSSSSHSNLKLSMHT
jgi:hypothetical protein